MNESIDLDQEDPEEAPEPEPVRASKPKRPRIIGSGAPAAAAPKFQRATNDAQEIWDQLQGFLVSQGLSPSSIAISLKRLTPPAQNGQPLSLGRGFGGEAVTGGESMSPGEALVDFIIRYIHLRTTQNPATYLVTFNQKTTGQQIAQGNLTLPSAAECSALLSMQNDLAQAQPQPTVGFSPSPGYGALPPQQQPAFQPQPFQPWGGFGAPQAPAQDNTLAQQLIALLRDRTDPAGLAAPPAAPAMSEDALVDRVAAKVLLGLRAAGVGVSPPVAPTPAPAVTSVAIPPSATQQSATSGMGAVAEKLVTRMFDAVGQALEQQVSRTIKTTLGVGAPGESEEAEEEPPPPEPEKPEDALPWKVASVGAKWGDGREMNVAVNKETKNVDLQGSLMANPIVLERAMSIAEGLGNAIKDAVVKMTTQAATPVAGMAKPAQIQAAPHVVSELPAGVLDGTPANGIPTGSGWEST